MARKLKCLETKECRRKSSKKYKWGLREPNKNPIYFKSKKGRDKAIEKTKKGAWVINLKI